MMLHEDMTCGVFEPGPHVMFIHSPIMDIFEWDKLIDSHPRLYSYIHSLYMSIPDIHDWFEQAQPIMYDQTGILMWRCHEKVHFVIVDHHRFLAWELGQ